MIRVKPNYISNINHIDYSYSYTQKDGYLKLKFYDYMREINNSPDLDIKQTIINMINSRGLGDTLLCLLSDIHIRVNEDVGISNITINELTDTIITLHISGLLAKFIYDRINDNCSSGTYIIYRMLDRRLSDVAMMT